MTNRHFPDDLTLHQKASLGSGASFWSTKTVAGLPPAVLTDGPHGVRADLGVGDHLGMAPSAPATCFPPAAGLAQSWDPQLVERVGAALADEARAHGVGVLLGPGVNIKRDPRCGRNFEYYSEDPHLSGVLGAAWVRGLQSHGVGASVKHFAANNVEYDRMRSDSQIDDRALREIYLKSFQRVVTEARPWTVMCAYNKINGVYAFENRWLLTEVLREQWGFDGAVVSDWGAVGDRVSAMAAGLDLAMPGGDPSLDDAVVAAVEAGNLDEAAVDAAARNVLTLLQRVADSAPKALPADLDAHHDLAREVARRCVALLKNQDALLPLEPSCALAVIGSFAEQPRYQGGGSSHVNAASVDIPLEQIRAHARGEVVYAPGFGVDGDDQRLREDAAAIAGGAEVAVVFLGLADCEESEGFDREHIDLPEQQLNVLRAVVAAQPHTVAVLCHGGAVKLAEVDRLVQSILDGGLLGQAGGGAIADVLFGAVNPSGRLAETVPVRIEDAPSFLNFPGENSQVRYGESIYVGYRWYDARQVDPTYCFGHGLSYTTFSYGAVRAESDGDDLVVTLPVTNSGDRDGREIVQVYVSKLDSSVRRAPKELKGFQAIDVTSGATADVTIRIIRNDLAYWEERVDGWIVEGGTYTIHVGSSSKDIRCTTDVDVDGDKLAVPLTENSTIGEVMAHPTAGPLFASLAAQTMASMADTSDTTLGVDVARVAASVPLSRIAAFGRLPRETLDGFLKQIRD
ncbi:MAG: glycoside hydrolase family 3 C-terminal domain-containing protein [Mycobacterium sp.]|nr:glycoside hydrolase family 3 C-terminal domain-containing protein [Mycobacterium sp.]